MKMYVTSDSAWGTSVWGSDVELEYSAAHGQNEGKNQFWDKNCDDRGGSHMHDFMDRLVPYGPELETGEVLEIEVKIIKRYKIEECI